MSRVLPPIGLRERLFGPRRSARPDDPTIDRIERALRRLEPDALYRRRLRSAVLNQYVAEREGLARRCRAPRREMGSLGRSVLYASLTLAIGVTAVGAAAQNALPGEALYPVKRQLELVRIQVAPPELRDDLAALALAERVEELERLAAAGDWSRLTAAAAHVVAAERLVLRLAPPAAAPEAIDARAVEVLESVLAKAPAAARPGLETAIQAMSADSQGSGRGSEPPPHGKGGSKDNGRAAQPPGPRDHDAPKPTPPGQVKQGQGSDW